MMRMTAKNSSGSDARPGDIRQAYSAMKAGLFWLSSCFCWPSARFLASAAMNTSVDETDISNNEVIVKKVFSMAESGLPLAAIPLLRTQGEGRWDADCDNPVYLNDYDSDEEADEGVIQIFDGNFLFEGRD